MITKFRDFDTDTLEQYRDLKVTREKAIQEEHDFYKRKAYRFPAYIKQLDIVSQELSDCGDLINAIDKEIDKRL